MDSQTRQLPGPDPAPEPASDPAGPRITGAQARDFTRLRRSHTDRYVGGVAGGLGRQFDVDPVLARVVLVVLAFFGGAGLLVYAAIWLLVPADDQERAPLELGPDIAKVLVVVAVVVAGLAVLGIPWFGADGGWIPWPLILVAVLVTWLVTHNRERRQTPPPPPYDAAASTSDAATTVADAPPAAAPPAAGTPGAPAGWGPQPPPLPPRPRRTGTVLFWPTLAAIAVALGVLGLVDVSRDVPLSAYAALALAVTGVALLVGAFWSRPGGLIALGLVLVVALGATSTADAVDAFGPYSDTAVTPASAADVRSGTYDAPSGEFTLDLREVADPASLDGRTIAVQMDVGRLEVIVPPGVGVEAASEIRWAGSIVHDGQSTGGATGFGVTGPVGPPVEAPTLRLDLELGVGEIDVWQAADEVVVP